MSLSMNALARAIEGQGQARPDFAQAWAVERQQEAIQRSMRERLLKDRAAGILEALCGCNGARCWP